MHAVRPRRFAVLSALAALAAVLAACGGASASGSSTSGVAGAAAARTGAVVKLRKTALGPVLVDARGRALYLFTPDKGKTSVCYGTCAKAWPPLLTSAKPRAGKGVKTRLLGTTKRKGGKLQVTYAGHPLYLFVKDRKAGQTTGQGVQGIWWVLNSAGKKVTRRAARSTASTTLQLRPTSLGMVLADSKGMTLYLYTPDTSSVSTCYGGCASAWPPLIARGRLAAGKGVDDSLLGTAKRKDGKLQVTYAGHPVYYFANDSKAGQTSGQGLGGVWYALDADGSKLDDDAAGATTTTTGDDNGGY